MPNLRDSHQFLSIPELSTGSRTIRWIHRILYNLPEVVSASGPHALPSTRAGGQDDVSLNKLPQTIYYTNLYYSCMHQYLWQYYDGELQITVKYLRRVSSVL